YGSSSSLDPVFVTGHSVVLSGLSSSTLYHYRVKSKDSSGNPATSSDFTFTTADITPPSAPSSLNATAASSSQINLSWTASTDNVGVSGYWIERCQGAGCSNFTRINASLVTNPSYNDSGLASGTNYSYRVQAADAAGNLSAYSNTVGATTLPIFTLDVATPGTGIGTVTSTPSGISCKPTCQASFDSGAVVTLTAVPSIGSDFSRWTGCDTPSGTSCTVTMTAAKSVTATFTAQTFTLTVTNEGPGSGTVTSDPIGISCQPTCQADFNFGAVTLTATPDSGSAFGGWTGCNSADGTSCTVNMNAAKAVTATFTKPVLTVTISGSGSVTINPPGINCDATCSAPYNLNSQVTLTATPNSLSVFTGWSGACTNLIGDCVVTMSSDQSVQANFSP
ncbi:MAG: fibronectin type III domain-containing protein, partial [Candidatus Manganitrophaceae bacterium]